MRRVDPTMNSADRIAPGINDAMAAGTFQAGDRPLAAFVCFLDTSVILVRAEGLTTGGG